MLMAGDMPRPDWRVSAGDDDKEERRARDELAGKLRSAAVEVGVCCGDALNAWQTRAAPVVRRREAREAGRAWMRLVMRAWREQADVAAGGERAHAREWGERWQRAPAGCALAARTLIPPGAARLWQEEGWRMRVLLAWQRLVRRNKIVEGRAKIIEGRAAQARANARVVQPRVTEHRRAQLQDEQPHASLGPWHAAQAAAAAKRLITVGDEPQRTLQQEERSNERPQQQEQHERHGQREQHGQRERREQLHEARLAPSSANSSSQNDGGQTCEDLTGNSNRRRRHDGTLQLHPTTRGRLTEHLSGRLAHARHRRGQG